MKKYFALAGILAAAGLLVYSFTLWKEEAAQDGLTLVRIAHTNGQFTVAFPILLGTETGIFAKHGLEVRGEEMTSGVAIPALLSGSVDYVPFTPGAAAAILQGAELKIVAAISEHPFLFLISRTDIAPKDIKVIGIGSKGGTNHYLALQSISRLGINAELTETGNNNANGRAMLERGDVDAAILNYFAPFDFESAGLAIADRFEQLPMATGLATLQKNVDEKPADVARVIASFRDIAKYIRDNPEETKNILYRFYGFEERTEAAQRKVEESYRLASQYFSVSGLPSRSGMEHVIRIAKAGDGFDTLEDVLSQSVTDEDIQRVFDFHLVEQ